MAKQYDFQSHIREAINRMLNERVSGNPELWRYEVVMHHRPDGVLERRELKIVDEMSESEACAVMDNYRALGIGQMAIAKELQDEVDRRMSKRQQ